MLKGYGVGRKTKNLSIKGLDKISRFDIFTNFHHYGLPLPEIAVMDVSNPAFTQRQGVFDSIVCDPPYGVRARSQKVGVSVAK